MSWCKAPSKSLIPDLIKQFDEGYDVLQDKTDRHSSSAAPKPGVNPVKALWEVKGIRFPESYTIPNEQFLSEKGKFNSQSSATTASKTHLENFGVPKNKSEEDSFLEMGLQMSLKDTVNTPIVVSDTSETVDSEDEPTQGLNLLFEAANILDDILD